MKIVWTGDTALVLAEDGRVLGAMEYVNTYMGRSIWQIQRTYADPTTVTVPPGSMSHKVAALVDWADPKDEAAIPKTPTRRTKKTTT